MLKMEKSAKVKHHSVIKAENCSKPFMLYS